MWFQDEYVYRRDIQVESPTDVPAGHPVTVRLNSTLFPQGKTRSDFEDIEVVYFQPDLATPTNTVLYREVEYSGLDLWVSFNLQEDLLANIPVNGVYYIYSGNPDLENQPTRPLSVIDEWPVTIGYDEGEITYTRPGEHWVEGESSTKGARANLVFYGTQVQILSQTDFDHAIFEARVDDRTWKQADLFSTQPEVKSVFSEVGLDPEIRHELTVRVIGDSNPTALGDNVNIVSVQYRKPVIATDLGEQVNDLVWSSSVGGA